MCYYMGFKVSKDRFIRLKQIEKDFGATEALKVLHDAFSYSDMPVIVPTHDKQNFEEVLMHWEFIPNYVNTRKELEMYRRGIDPKTSKKGLPIPWMNAKGENLMTSRMWKDSALKRRGLLHPAHFFEWRHVTPEGRKTSIKYPYVIELRQPENYFMAAIWNPWTDKETGEMMNTMASVTTVANSFMAQIHNSKLRMPTFLPRELAERWLFDELSEQEITKIATYQVPSGEMKAYTIPKEFKKIEDPLQSYEYADLPPLEICE